MRQELTIHGPDSRPTPLSLKLFSHQIQQIADPTLLDTKEATIDATSTSAAMAQTVALERSMMAILGSLTIELHPEAWADQQHDVEG